MASQLAASAEKSSSVVRQLALCDGGFMGASWTLSQRSTDSQTLRRSAHHVLARSLYRGLRGNGYTPAQILALSAEMVSLVTSDYGTVDIARTGS